MAAGEIDDALMWFMRLGQHPAFSNQTFQDCLGPLVESRALGEHLELFDCWRALAPLLGRDLNVSGMLVYALAGGKLCGDEAPEVPTLQITSLSNLAADELHPPAWANDLVHVMIPGPSDSRFAGTIENFARMVRAYRKFGRLDPNDPWDAEINSRRLGL